MSLEKEDLVEGQIYKVVALNYEVAVWDGEKFQGAAHVDGQYEMIAEHHYSDGYPKGTVKPIRPLSKLRIRPPYGTNTVILMAVLDIALDPRARRYDD